MSPLFHSSSPRKRWRPTLLRGATLLSVLLALLTPQWRAYGQVQGTIPGGFSVDSNGGATYHVPIEVPPGAVGMEPQLALAYSSQHYNGLLGVGWSLSGLSAISRCPKTLETDLVNGGIHYNGNDVFCLDGERLILASGTVYGNDGTTYRTQRESWMRVQASGSCAGGPCSFTVTSKNGTVMQFGSRADSRIEAQGKSVVSTWALDRVQDLRGNYLEVFYAEDTANGQYHPDEIRYTGNASAGVTPTRRVKFIYEARPDPILRYLGGSLIRQTQRLRQIQTYINTTTPVQTYTLNYEVGAATARSRIRSITLCDAASLCLPETRFSFLPEATHTFGVSLLPDFTNLKGDETNLIPGDFNGDGRADFIRQEKNNRDDDDTRTAELFLSQWDGTFAISLVTDFTRLKGDKTNLIPGDFNGDGRLDFIRQERSDWDDDNTTTAELFLSQWDGTFAVSLLTDSNNLKGDETNLIPGDFNGDGRTDFLRQEKNNRDDDDTRTAELFLSRGDGTFAIVPVTDFTRLKGDETELIPGDYNGDGMTDFIRQERNNWDNDETNTAEVFLSWGDGTFSVQLATNYASLKGDETDLIPGDFNGDGVTDFIRQEKNNWDNDDTYTAELFLGRGDGTFAVSLMTDSNNLKGDATNLIPGDFNGDGRTDFLRQEKGGGSRTAELFLSRGDGTFAIVPVTDAGSLRGDETNLILGDYNGDGRTEFLRQERNTWDDDDVRTAELFQTDKIHPDLVTDINTGLKERVRVIYRPLTDNIVYAKGTGATYPLRDAQPAMYVVATHIQEDGYGTESYTSHAYGGALVNMRGQGWLGFRWASATDGQSKVTTRTWFNQHAPYTGTAQSRIRLDANGNPMEETVFVYDSVTTVPGVAFVRPSERRMSFFADGGAWSYTMTTRYQYDAYGNVTLFSDLGKTDRDGTDRDASDNLFLCTSYSNDSSGWSLGFPLAQKLVKASAGCNNLSTWDGANDLRFRSHAYDSTRKLTQLQEWDTSYGGWSGASYGYDTVGNLSSVTDALGRVETTSYRSPDFTFPQTHTFANGYTMTSEYDARFGVMSAMTDVNGHREERSFDGFGRLTQVRGPNPSGVMTTMKTFQLQANATGIHLEERSRRAWNDDTTANWHWVREYIDGLGRTRKVEAGGPGAQVVVRDMSYDSQGRLWRNSLPYFQGATPQYVERAYNIHDQPTGIYNPNGSAKLVDYDRQNLTTKTWTHDPRDTATTSSVVGTTRYFNHRGRLLREVDPAGAVTEFEYDLLGQLVRRKDPLGNLLTLSYDSMGRLVQRGSPETGALSLSYDRLGRLTGQTDAKGQATTFEYDALNRPTRKTLPGPKVITFTYDEARANSRGRLTRVSMPEATYRFDYDRSGRLTTEQVTLDGVTYVSQVAFDPMGRPESMTYPDGAVLRYTYDGAGHLDTLALDGVTHARYSNYNAFGQHQRLDYGNAVITVRQYDLVGRLSALETYQSGTSYVGHLKYAYQYNLANKLLTLTDQLNSAQTQSFAYDIQGRLASATGPYAAQTYLYDLAGNLTSHQQGSPVNNTIHYSYDATKRHQVTSSSSATTGGCMSAGYDANGNMTSRSERGADCTSPTWNWSYTYDAENHLKEVWQGSNLIQRHAYNYEGQRIRKTEADGKTTLTPFSHYEVVTFPGGRQEHTKYIHGLDGTIASITRDGASVLLVPGWAAGPGLLESLWSGEVTMLAALEYGGQRFTRWAAQSETWLWGSRLLLAGVFLWLLFGFARLLLQASSGDTGLGRLRRLLVRNLHGRGWVGRERMEALVRTQGTYFMRRHAWYRLALPLVLVAFSASQARLMPGTNGEGYPVPGVFYFHPNHLGSTEVLTGVKTSASAPEVSRAFYRPYGAIDDARSSGQDIFRAKFTGKEWDNPSRLYFFGARYYEPSLGRFLSPDPAGQFDSPYVYAGGDPEAFVDPDGEFAFLIIGLLAVAGAYFGGSAVNHSMNPLKWNWKSGKTYAGMLGGAVISVAGGEFVAAAAAESAALGLAAASVSGAVENASFTAMGGGSASEILEAAGIGAALGLVAEGGARLLGTAIEHASGGASSLLRRGSEAGEEVGHAAESAEASEAQASMCSMMSFTAGTPVVTAHGATAIEKLQVAEQVWSYDEALGERRLAPVSQLYSRVAPDYLVLTLGQERVETTPEHPFYVESKGWTKAGELQVGDRLRTLDGNAVALTGVESREGPVRVYNLTVDETQTYHVSESKLLTHNVKCLSKRETALGRTPGKNSKAGREVQKRWSSKMGSTSAKLRKVSGKLEVKVRVTKGGPRVWKPLDRKIHMGHKLDAVEAWNQGIPKSLASDIQAYSGVPITPNKPLWKLGARSAEARAFMQYPGNYRFEWGPLNSSNGASLGTTYHMPAGWTPGVGPW